MSRIVARWFLWAWVIAMHPMTLVVVFLRSGRKAVEDTRRDAHAAIERHQQAFVAVVTNAVTADGLIRERQ